VFPEQLLGFLWTDPRAGLGLVANIRFRTRGVSRIQKMAFDSGTVVTVDC
jgi:hypothetical protein